MSKDFPTTQTCVAQADLLLLIAKMLEPVQAWRDEDRCFTVDEIDALAAASGLAGLDEGQARLGKSTTAWQTADPERTPVEYARLFEGAVACPCNETVYIRRDKGALLADISGFYRAFGFELSDRFQEKHDHIVVELQFAALLLVLLGRAVQSGTEEQRQIVRGALHGFIDDHLGAWLGLFATRLETTAEEPVYRHVARLTACAWSVLFVTHGFQDPGDEVGPVLQEVGTPYECGLCESAGEVAGSE